METIKKGKKTRITEKIYVKTENWKDKIYLPKKNLGKKQERKKAKNGKE